MSKLRRSNSNPFTMSFLDTVSAGFGAAFFLFVIFASLPIEKGSGMMGSEEFIDMNISWTDEDAVIELLIFPPNSEPIRIYEAYGATTEGVIVNPFTGQVTVQGMKKLWHKIIVTGTSTYGQSYNTDTNNNKKSIWIKILAPCNGSWKFAVAQKNFVNILDHTSTNFNFYSRILTSKNNNKIPAATASTNLNSSSHFSAMAKSKSQPSAMLNWSEKMPVNVSDSEPGNKIGKAPITGSGTYIVINYEEDELPPYCSGT